MPRSRKTKQSRKGDPAQAYRHPEAELLLRPEVGTQAQFRKKKAPVTYRYDSSLSPSMEWDGLKAARERGEWLIAMIEEAVRLEPPHLFPTPREFTGTDGRALTSVTGLSRF
jgi:adenine-specific DNA-methyltransferase